MPRLACWSCGRSLYTVSPLESLFTEERRCPRCGAFLQPDRRVRERRVIARRVNTADRPGPPTGVGERRRSERRRWHRRGSSSEAAGPRAAAVGWARRR